MSPTGFNIVGDRVEAGRAVTQAGVISNAMYGVKYVSASGLTAVWTYNSSGTVTGDIGTSSDIVNYNISPVAVFSDASGKTGIPSLIFSKSSVTPIYVWDLANNSTTAITVTRQVYSHNGWSSGTLVYPSGATDGLFYWMAWRNVPPQKCQLAKASLDGVTTETFLGSEIAGQFQAVEAIAGDDHFISDSIFAAGDDIWLLSDGTTSTLTKTTNQLFDRPGYHCSDSGVDRWIYMSGDFTLPGTGRFSYPSRWLYEPGTPEMATANAKFLYGSAKANTLAGSSVRWYVNASRQVMVEYPYRDSGDSTDQALLLDVTDTTSGNVVTDLGAGSDSVPTAKVEIAAHSTYGMPDVIIPQSLEMP